MKPVANLNTDRLDGPITAECSDGLLTAGTQPETSAAVAYLRKIEAAFPLTQVSLAQVKAECIQEGMSVEDADAAGKRLLQWRADLGRQVRDVAVPVRSGMRISGKQALATFVEGARKVSEICEDAGVLVCVFRDET